MDTQIPEKPKKPYHCQFGRLPLNLHREWFFRLTFLWIHVGALQALLHLSLGQVAPEVLLPMAVIYLMAILGTTIGSHRLWAHRSFKASLPLRVGLAISQTTATQQDIFTWAWNHRIHHKYSDTDADPHNSQRGFWFSHINWLFLKRHPAYLEKMNSIDVADLDEDGVVRFQNRYFWSLQSLMNFIIPISIILYAVPTLTFYQACCLNMLRISCVLHATFCVNSVAHIWGYKPYDKSMPATENHLVSFVSMGEGWHNYHHAFPWDYRAAEDGFFSDRLSTKLIDLFAFLGLAKDLRSASPDLIEQRVGRTGDKSVIHKTSVLCYSAERDNNNDGRDSAFLEKLIYSGDF